MIPILGVMENTPEEIVKGNEISWVIYSEKDRVYTSEETNFLTMTFSNYDFLFISVKQNCQESIHQPLDCFAMSLVALFVHVGMSKSQNQSLIPMVAPDIIRSKLAPLLQETGVTAMAAILEMVISHSA